jgi:penicillin-binding protein 1A
MGVADADGRTLQPTADGDGSLFRPGTGGLY